MLTNENAPGKKKDQDTEDLNDNSNEMQQDEASEIPDLDEQDLEENDLTVEEADNIEWDEKKQ